MQEGKDLDGLRLESRVKNLVEKFIEARMLGKEKKRR